MICEKQPQTRTTQMTLVQYICFFILRNILQIIFLLSVFFITDYKIWSHEKQVFTYHSQQFFFSQWDVRNLGLMLVP